MCVECNWRLTVKRRPALLVVGVEQADGVEGEQIVECGRGDAEQAGQVWRRIAESRGAVNVGAALDQIAHGAHALGFDGVVERQAVVLVRRVQVVGEVGGAELLESGAEAAHVTVQALDEIGLALVAVCHLVQVGRVHAHDVVDAQRRLFVGRRARPVGLVAIAAAVAADATTATTAAAATAAAACAVAKAAVVVRRVGALRVESGRGAAHRLAIVGAQHRRLGRHEAQLALVILASRRLACLVVAACTGLFAARTGFARRFAVWCRVHFWLWFGE